MPHSTLVPMSIYTLMLFVPGYLCLRCARLSRIWALCCAPILSTALVGVIGEVYASVGVAATPLTVYGLATGLPLLAVIVMAVTNRNGGGEAGSGKHAVEAAKGSTARLAEDIRTWWVPLLFVIVGTAICNNLFISELPSADAILQNYDIQHHLNGIQSLADAHRVSSRGFTSYLSSEDAAIMPFGSKSFYPAVWYGQCALLMQTAGIFAPMAINASLAVTLALAFPLGMYAFASQVFGRSKGVVAFASLTCVGFVAFPWCLVLFGPLYPNLVGFALIPASMTLCMRAFRAGPAVRDRIISWAVAVLALVGQALLHPNTLFSMFVILVPFVAQLIYETASAHGASRRKAVLFVLGFLAVCLAFWVICYKLPMFAAAINEYWPDYAYPWQEVVNILTQTYTLFFYYELAAQVLLGALVVVGFVRAAYDQDVRWLAASYLLACLICFVCASFSNATLKRFIAGFWYTDAMRVTATAVTVAAPLAAYGLDWVYEQVCRVLQGYNERLGRPTHRRVAALVLGLCFVVLNFMPGFNWPGAHAESTDHIAEYRMDGHEYDSNSVKTTFGDYRQLVRNQYGSNAPLDVHEQAFLEEARAIVGDDLVINDPTDGSTLAYGAYGIRVYYRSVGGRVFASNETPQSLTIRERLCDIASDGEVRQAVEGIGARYVLVMDATYSTSSFLNLRGTLDGEEFRGISHVSADTPGFTEVLSSGSCHLYRID